MAMLAYLRDDLSNAFTGEFRGTMHCTRCATAKKWNEEFSVLTIRPGRSVAEALAKMDFLVLSEFQKCEKCSSCEFDTPSVEFVRRPTTLVFQIHRQGDSRGCRKDAASVRVCDTVNLGNTAYALKGVVDHHGSGMGSGHYSQSHEKLGHLI